MNKMIAYNIRLDSNISNLKIVSSSIEMKAVNIHIFHPNKEIPLDKDFMYNKYGFYLSKNECNQFVTHRKVWEMFRKSNHPLCMIFENSVQFKFPLGEQLCTLREQLINNVDWDIFFPFEKDFPKSYEEVEQGYMLGCYWGVDIYFLSQRGAEKLLGIETIKQSLDEEILDRSDNELEIYIQKDCLDFTINPIHKKNKQQVIKEAIFNSDVWSEENKKKIRSLIYTISQTAYENNIELVLSYGTLLGQVRHGCIMPWDDDVDLALNKNEFDNFFTFLNNKTNLKSCIRYFGKTKFPFLKIWDETGQDIPNYPYKFPFVDIWFYKETDDNFIFDDGLIYPRDIYRPFSDVYFEGSMFKLPNNPVRCLDISYPKWKSTIQVYPLSHQLENYIRKPLTLNISVDKSGRLINEIK